MPWPLQDYETQLIHQGAGQFHNSLAISTVCTDAGSAVLLRRFDATAWVKNLIMRLHPSVVFVTSFYSIDLTKIQG